MQGALQAPSLPHRLAETARRGLPVPVLNDRRQLERFLQNINEEKISVPLYSDRTSPAAASRKLGGGECGNESRATSSMFPFFWKPPAAGGLARPGLVICFPGGGGRMVSISL